MTPIRRRALASLVIAGPAMGPSDTSLPLGKKSMPDNQTTPPEVIKDSSGQEWTKDEVQALVNQVNSLTTAAARLGLNSISTLRSMGIKTTAEWVRDKSSEDPQWLPKFIIMHGGVANAAAYLNVSVSHLEGVLRKQGYEVRLPIPDSAAAETALKKFGSVLYVARLFHTTPNLVKKAVPNWRDYQDATKAGDHSTRTGTIGEKYYEKLRGPMITDDPANRNHNHPGYDYLDSEFGKVNVKAIPPRAKGRWVWEIDPRTNCDAFGLVQLDAGKSPVGLVILTKNQLTDPPPGMLSTPRSNGDIAISTQIHFQYAPIPGSQAATEAQQPEI